MCWTGDGGRVWDANFLQFRIQSCPSWFDACCRNAWSHPVGHRNSKDIVENPISAIGMFHVRAPNGHGGMVFHDSHVNHHGRPNVLGPNEVRNLIVHISF